MGVKDRANYWRRVFSAYVLPGKSQLTFWHDVPEINDYASMTELGDYYMTFTAKADYVGEFDEAGIPLLNYRGSLGLQYNPIAIAQYGLANFNRWSRTGDPNRRDKVIAVADWLVTNLEENEAGVPVWNHHFDWEYRTTLKAPWYSALAQGQGISLLVRAHGASGERGFLDAAERAFSAFTRDVHTGGVVYVDGHGHPWLEEYIVDPPTHILNGFIWATWGVRDYYLATRDPVALKLFDQSVETIATNLDVYDAGFWSLYEISGTRMRMLASPFYHALHITQLKVMHHITGIETFKRYAERWEGYTKSRMKRSRALAYKVAFKIVHY